MKKKTLTLIMAAALAAGALAGCGKAEETSVQDTENVAAVQEDAQNDVQEDVDAVQSTETADDGVMAVAEGEEVEAGAEDAAEAGEEAEAVAEESWVDTLRDNLVNNNYEAVIALLNDPELGTMAAEYEYTDFHLQGGGEAYKMTTTDGETVGIVIATSGICSKNAFYCQDESRDYGFDHLEYGDRYASTWTNEGVEINSWFDGQTIYFGESAGSEPVEIEPGETVLYFPQD